MTTNDPTTDPTTTEEHDMHDEHTTPATAPTNDNGAPADEHTTPGIDTAPPADEAKHPADEHSGDPRVKSARAEAAKYRTRLRETENQLAETNQRYEAMLRQIITATAKEHHGINGEALWDSGVDPTDLLNDDGEIDLDKVTNACDVARKRYGIPKAVGGPIVPSVGTTAQVYRNAEWADVLKDIGLT